MQKKCFPGGRIFSVKTRKALDHQDGWSPEQIPYLPGLTCLLSLLRLALQQLHTLRGKSRHPTGACNYFWVLVSRECPVWMTRGNKASMLSLKCLCPPAFLFILFYFISRELLPAVLPLRERKTEGSFLVCFQSQEAGRLSGPDKLTEPRVSLTWCSGPRISLLCPRSCVTLSSHSMPLVLISNLIAKDT